MRATGISKTICLYSLNGGSNPFQRTKVTEADLDTILTIPGVEELTYDRLRQTIVIMYDRHTLDPKRLGARLKKMFPAPGALQKELSLQECGKRGVVSRVTDRFVEKVDERTREKINRCRELALMMPVETVLKPTQLYFRRVIAPTWFEFIWAFIAL
jgi:hypothetical protein